MFNRTLPLLFITLVFCILVGQALSLTKPLIALAVGITAVVFIVSFLSPEAALYILIFSMLLGPEFIVGELVGRAVAGRGITLRLDDFLLVVIGFSWFLRSAIHKELGLFLRTPLNIPIFFTPCRLLWLPDGE